VGGRYSPPATTGDAPLRTSTPTILIRFATLAETAFNFNSLRHTVGTQLASAGYPPKKSRRLETREPRDCRAYVDINFHDMIGQLK